MSTTNKIVVIGIMKYLEKIHVWVCILGGKIVGPVFLTKSLTGDISVDLLENTIQPLIIQVLVDP